MSLKLCSENYWSNRLSEISKCDGAVGVERCGIFSREQRKVVDTLGRERFLLKFAKQLIFIRVSKLVLNDSNIFTGGTS